MLAAYTLVLIILGFKCYCGI